MNEEEGAVVSPTHSIPFPSSAKIVFSAAGKEPSKVRATLGNARHEDSVNSGNVINVIFRLSLPLQCGIGDKKRPRNPTIYLSRCVRFPTMN